MDAVVERFFSKTTPGENGCIDWLAARDRDGYGVFSFVRQYRAHRFAYEIAHGAIPEGLTIDHLCRNRGCVSVHHLEAVTSRTNTQRGERATRTHCVNGHEYTPENTRVASARLGGPKRVCVACARAAKARQRGIA